MNISFINKIFFIFIFICFFLTGNAVAVTDTVVTDNGFGDYTVHINSSMFVFTSDVLTGSGAGYTDLVYDSLSAPPELNYSGNGISYIATKPTPNAPFHLDINILLLSPVENLSIELNGDFSDPNFVNSVITINSVTSNRNLIIDGGNINFNSTYDIDAANFDSISVSNMDTFGMNINSVNNIPLENIHITDSIFFGLGLSLTNLGANPDFNITLDRVTGDSSGGSCPLFLSYITCNNITISDSNITSHSLGPVNPAVECTYFMIDRSVLTGDMSFTMATISNFVITNSVLMGDIILGTTTIPTIPITTFTVMGSIINSGTSTPPFDLEGIISFVFYNNSVVNTGWTNLAIFSISPPPTIILNVPVPDSGTNIAGGPNIAGNYWTNPPETAFSDTEPPNSLGYTTVPFSVNFIIDGIPSSVSDLFPLVIYIPPSVGPDVGHTTGNAVISSGETEQGTSSETSDNAEGLQITESIEMPAEESATFREYSTGSVNFNDYPNGGGSFGGAIVILKEEEVEEASVIADYILPAATVAGLTANAFLIIILKMIDLFFSIKGEEIRESIKTKSFKMKFRFSPPPLKEIFTARTGFKIIIFAIGFFICSALIQQFVNDVMDGGLLTYVMMTGISPLLVSKLISIPGGLLFGEIIGEITDRLVSFIRQNSLLPEQLHTNRHLNFAVLILTLGITCVIGAFSVMFLGWTFI
jgi:Periplasmic copper-binding protein (NosD).